MTYALPSDLANQATPLKKQGEPVGVIQMLIKDSIYQSFFVKDKVINQGAWWIPVKAPKARFVWNGCSQPQFVPQMCVQVHIWSLVPQVTIPSH